MVELKFGSDAHSPIEIGVKMSEFRGVIDEECHNCRGFRAALSSSRSLVVGLSVVRSVGLS